MSKATRHALKSRGDDLYETPPVAVQALADEYQLPDNIWEPACGPGAIVSVLRQAGHSVKASDLVDWGCQGASTGIDFLMELNAPDGYDTILTNPPFKLADQFVRQSRILVPTTIMLLRLAFLEADCRTDILESGDLARVIVFRKRLPMMHRHGWEGKKTDNMVAYAWFIWERDHKGPAEISRC